MGFYLRKSVRAGPFRFNLSKSGVGVSAGVPGFRIGSGPRGNYVHAGRHGVYYRATLGGRPRAQQVQPPYRPWVQPPSAEVLLEDVTGASAGDLVATAPGDLVDQLNAAAGRHRIAPWLIAALGVVLLVKPIIGAFLLIPGAPTVAWFWLHDRARRSVVAFYDVNDEIAAWFDALVSAISALGRAEGLWRINATGAVKTTYQYKVNAGATTIVSRAVMRTGLTGPRVLATNIAIPMMTSGRQALHFLPDRLLVREGRRFSDVPYRSLTVDSAPNRFIEDGGVPGDSQQVDTTWRFINKSGGPDRRFNNNRQLPVMLYGRLVLSSKDGLLWLIDVSKAALADQVATAIKAAPRALEHRVADSMPVSS